MVELSPSILADLPLKRWTVDDCHRMLASGMLTPEDRVELLDGQIVEMVPQDPPTLRGLMMAAIIFKSAATGIAGEAFLDTVLTTPQSSAGRFLWLAKLLRRQTLRFNPY